MSRLFYHTMQDNAGNLLFNVSGTMRHAGTGTVATIYGDEALTVVLPNPMTNHPNFGSFKCYLAAGSYDFYMAKAGYTFETLTGVQGMGTMALQNADAVSITGGTGLFTGMLQTTHAPASGVAFNVTPGRAYLHALGVGVALPDSAAQGRLDASSAILTDVLVQGAPASGRTLTVSPGRAYIHALGVGINIADGAAQGRLEAGAAVVQGLTVNGDATLTGAVIPLTITFPKAGGGHGLIIRGTGTDTLGGYHILFHNAAGAIVGSIATNATTTGYNTTSDGRLKHAITPLTGALDVVRALNPVSFLWKADGSPGRGLLAGEVQEVIPDGVITGERGALDDDGRILPQMIDYSKLVPYLIGAVKELTQQVEMLQAQLAAGV